MIPFHGVELTNQMLQSYRNGLVDGQRRRLNKHICGSQKHPTFFGDELKNLGMGTQIAVNRRKDRLLIIPLRDVARYPRHPQFVKRSGNILMLEFNRAMGSANLLHESSTMFSLYIRPADKVRLEHGEIIGNDGVKLVVLPMGAYFCLVGHLPTLAHSEVQPESQSAAPN